MSDQQDKPITPGVKKAVRRFAPTLRGRARSSASPAATPKAEPTSAGDTPSPSPAPSAGTPAKELGHIRSETAPEGRLPSVHDGQKTRGGAMKMKFKPTIPAKRNKKETSSSVIDQALTSTRGEGSRERGRGRGRGRGERGRGRGRGGPGRGIILVEESSASGIFSLGPSAMARSRNMPGGGYATYGGDAGSRQEAESNEETDMSALFWNTNDEYTPVVFPHVSRLASDFDPLDLSITPRRVPWLVVDTPEETPAEKPEPKEDEESPVPVKTEPDTEEMDVDKNEKESEVEEKLKSPDAKPVTVAPETSSTTAAPAQSDPWYMYEDSAARNIFGVDKNNKVVSIAEDELLCFQLPSILPKFEKPPPPTIDVDEEEKPVKEEKDEKVKPLPAAAKKTSLEDAMSSLELQDMPDGCIGKVYVYKSGRMKMKLGNVMLEINQGMRSTFLENVMVIDTVSDQTKKAIELGHIVQKFVCSPDMDELLKEDEASSLS